MNLEDLKNIDLKNLDLKDLGAAPMPVKIALIGVGCALLLFLGYWFLISDKIDEYRAGQRKEQELRETFISKKAMAVNLPVYEEQMKEMNRTFGTMLRQLPNKAEVPNLLIDITQAGLGRGLDFVLFKPQKEKPVDFYAELPINITVKGTYHELGEFVSDLAALPRIVTIDDVDITKADKGDRLTMTALARTYRYLDESGAPATAAPAHKK